MSWDVRSTYHYLVCFATLLMVVFGTVQVVDQALALAYPRVYEPSVVDVYERMRRGPRPVDAADAAIADTLSEETLQRMAEEERRRLRESQRRDDLRRLLSNLALVLIAGPLYLYHWRRVR